MKFQARLFVLMFFGLLTSAPLFSQSDPFQNVGDDPFGGDEESTKRFIRMEGIKINVPGAELVQIISDGGSIRNIEIGPQQRKKIEGLQKKYLGELKELLGDEHVSEKDCLHYTHPGPIDFWNHLLATNLRDMSNAASLE